MKFGIVHGYTVWDCCIVFPSHEILLFAPSRPRDLRGDFAEGLAQGLAEGLAQGLSPPALRTSLREALDLRIADFKGCVLLPLLLLLFEKPSTFCRRRLTPEIEFSNSFRGL